MSVDIEAAMRAALDKAGFQGLPEVDPWEPKYQEPDKPALPMLPAPKLADRDVIHVGTDDARTYYDQRITLNGIMLAVSKVTGIGTADMKSERRAVRMVRARQIYFWVAKTYTSKSFPYIGRSCGGRDHSTIIHGYNKVNSRLPEYAKEIAAVVALLRLNPACQ